MELSDRDLALVSTLADGLPLVDRPYLAVGHMVGMSEVEVIERIKAMREAGIIRRFGVIVRHHELGFRANAMAVWDIPDAEVAALGARLGDAPEVTLCYRRPRRLPDWPYNLFCMIHGRDRATVEASIRTLISRHGLDVHPHSVLFSIRRFKQTGARYGRRLAAE
ncbi:AsnC family protein [Paramagnetospirillum kuznetsovii]|uniref:siroheme decarboxylase n=1 Tax=Paramagnetospirillum kuznetsovii TaxID=2053833 RepID=A0A364P2N2_9PROT|nr:Lrp/AsnC family transcriptional regulator [Paramagnetospirillum kuznetsovii]RAU23407.1 AsnC family protein [Paramagnetospirillum kuznetsovii]